MNDFRYFSGQLEHHRFSRILRTLDENYTGFKPALHEYVFNETQNETRHLVRQPGITTAEQGDIDRFAYDLYYEELKRDAPMLYNAIKGSMAIHYSYQQVTTLVAIVFRLVFLVHVLVKPLPPYLWTLKTSSTSHCGKPFPPPLQKTSSTFLVPL